MREEPKHFNYKALSEGIGIVAGLFLMFYLASLTGNLMRFFNVNGIGFGVLIYLILTTVICLPVFLINNKIEEYFDEKNENWRREWEEERKYYEMGRSMDEALKQNENK